MSSGAGVDEVSRPEPWVNAWWYQRDRRAAATARGPDPDHVDVRPQHVGAWEVVADEESKDGQLPLIGGTWLDRQVPRLPGHVTTLSRLRSLGLAAPERREAAPGRSEVAQLVRAP